MSFTFGINYPWVRCGHDFGPRPPAWAGAGPTDWAALEAELRVLRALGLEVARFWVLAGGVNLPVGQDPRERAERVPWLEPWPRWLRPLVRLRGAPERWRWSALPTLPKGFLDDFDALLGAASAASVRLVPSLLSFELFFPIRDTKKGVTSSGHASLALTPGFLDAALEPLLDVCEAHRQTIAAFEVANEPGWAARAGGFRTRFGPHPPWVHPLAMSELLVDGAARIARRGFVATVGFVDARVPWLAPSARGALGRLAASGRYVHQLHHYPTDRGGGALPPAAASPIRPIWVGEMGTSTARRWRDPEALEDDPDRYLTRRVEIVRERGYDGALLWSRTATDAQSRWDARVRAQIASAASR